ncbi:MAG TPA: hypothetical protein VGT08_03095 [Terracidiphilus sp.]|nr:hypothetical protein [Terracidiphilus sp.]
MGTPLRSAIRSLRTIDARGKLPAGILIPYLLIFALSITSCHKKTAAPVQQSQQLAPPQPAGTPAPSPEEQSCQAFVQNFYDWYWNRFAEQANHLDFDLHKLPNVETVLKRKPSVLSPELTQLLSDDEKKKQVTHQIGNLDFDPFWGNQDAQGLYVVNRVSVAGDRCKASILQGDEIAELKRSGSSWLFVNFYYCFTAYDSTLGRNCPDSDLVQILKQ